MQPVFKIVFIELSLYARVRVLYVILAAANDKANLMVYRT